MDSPPMWNRMGFQIPARFRKPHTRALILCAVAKMDSADAFLSLFATVIPSPMRPSGPVAPLAEMAQGWNGLDEGI